MKIGFKNIDFAQLRAQLPTFPSSFVLPVSAVPSMQKSLSFYLEKNVINGPKEKEVAKAIAKEMFSPVIKKFQRIQIQTHYKDECWSIDLIDR